MTQDPESLRALPSVSDALAHREVGLLIEKNGRELVLDWVRTSLEQLRHRLLAGNGETDRPKLLEELISHVCQRSRRQDQARLCPVINATGVILHTGLGRAPLAQAAITAVAQASGACNLELDLESGARRQRGYQLDDAWKTLTGACASLVVNNNAAATLLALQATCAGREVIISRGQLIEIGGSFRLPEIFSLSGAILREVGTTNHTYLSDYQAAINPQTAAILRVHPSNYRLVGFADTPDIASLVQLGHEHGLIVIDDIGSGCLRNMSEIAGLPAEPTFSESLAVGADLVLGSGDKLLGGPQCGIMLGRADVINTIRKHHLARAVRIDKLTLAALSATLEIYLRGSEMDEIPVLSMLATPASDLRARAIAIQNRVSQAGGISVIAQDATAPVGGGSLPGVELPTAVLALTHVARSADEIARQLRVGDIRVMGRIQDDQVLLDLRSVSPDDDDKLAQALCQLTSDLKDATDESQ